MNIKTQSIRLNGIHNVVSEALASPKPYIDCPLAVSQRIHGMQAGGLTSREKAEAYADGH
jgi:hypothetical protein